MAKLFWLACFAMLTVLPANSQNPQLSKYKKVEAYEIRPGILMMPRYTSDGQVCEIGLEKRHYSPEMIRTESALSSEEIDELVDELAPASVRGPKPSGLAGHDSILIDGHAITRTRNYENVVVEIDAAQSDRCKKGSICSDGDVVVTIRWKNRKCE
ncbi:MAG: hypothetical protein ABR860_06960 [Terracidiphilus sp.]|jgi:hypothetical protein